MYKIRHTLGQVQVQGTMQIEVRRINYGENSDLHTIERMDESKCSLQLHHNEHEKPV